MSDNNKKLYVVVSAPVASVAGYGGRARDFIRQLIKIKPEWDIKILSQKWGNTPLDALELGRDDDLLDRILYSKMETKPDIWIQITTPNEFQPVGNYNIGVTAGVETTILPADCVEGINRMDLVITSSKFSKKVMESTVFDKRDKASNQIIGQLRVTTPVEVLFEGIDLSVFDNNIECDSELNETLLKVKNDFCFLFVGHWLNGEFTHDRKNVGGMLYTFLSTFKNKTKQPALILKTSGASNSKTDRYRIIKLIESIKGMFKSTDKLPDIYILHSKLSDNQMNSLYNHPKIKAHLSFTRGEGFGRPLLEATISGKPMVVSNWSGPVDFLNPEFVSMIDGKLEKVHKSAANRFLMDGSEWFTINYDKAGSTMLDIFKNYKKYLELSRKHRKYTKDNFSLEAMGSVLNGVLETHTKNMKEPVKFTELKLPDLKELELPKLKKLD